MDPTKHLVLLNGKVKTRKVEMVDCISSRDYVIVTYVTSKKPYTYKQGNVKYLTDPILLEPDSCKFLLKAQLLDDVAQCWVFKDGSSSCMYVVFGSGKDEHYLSGEIKPVFFALRHPNARSALDYFRHMADHDELKDKEGNLLLPMQYKKLKSIAPLCVLSCYLNTAAHQPKTYSNQALPIFPFGCNASQYKAVVNALANQLSVIEGPPGTGKTQTILNIMANLLIQGKTMQIVSNSNSATTNVLEKLKDHNLNFLVASLGSNENKESFLKNQGKDYPDMSDWRQDSPSNTRFEVLQAESAQLATLFSAQERMAQVKQELDGVNLEYQHFLKQYTPPVSTVKKIPSQTVMNYWQTLSNRLLQGKHISWWLKLLGWFKFGIKNFFVDAQVLLAIKNLYYLRKIDELDQEHSALSDLLKQQNLDTLYANLSTHSMEYLKDYLYGQYAGKKKCTDMTLDHIRHNSAKVLQQYPIVLSSTFSSASNLDESTLFDYVIMDEASQINNTTAVLALSSAKNAVIVGDLKQLPHVFSEEMKKINEIIFELYPLDPLYSCEHSFLASICGLIPNLPRTLLREHYRCHPSIIQFCNEKFYDGQLVIMTEDKGEEDVLTLQQTAPGRHGRGRLNQREIDAIRDEIMQNTPFLQDSKKEEIAIIAPYKEQVNHINAEKKISSEASTIHSLYNRFRLIKVPIT